MSIKILMPALSPTMKEGLINKWLVKIGDIVNIGDIIAEIETDKATMEVEAVDSGKITHLIDTKSNQQIPVNSVIAILNGTQSDFIDIIENNYTKNKANEKSNNESKNEDIEKIKNISNFQDSNNDQRIIASPFAKKFAKKKNIDLNTIKGSGPNQRIIKRDFETIEQNVLDKKQNNDISYTTPNTIRKIIAKRTSEAKQNIPHFYLTVESKVDKLISLRKKINNYSNIKISFNDLIIKAVSLALQKNPDTNSSWKNDKILKHNDIDVSVAIALKEGLITPIIKKANLKGLKEISNEIKALAKLAKQNLLKPEQYTGGSITVSNLGMFGITEFSAIINQPQSSILAVGSIVQKPVVVNNIVVIGNTLKSTLSADHRILDGAIAAKLLKDFNDIIENPFEIWINSDDMEVI